MSWYEQIPKVELHLHLEGAIPHEALWELACKYGGDPEVPDIDALLRRFEYRDFPHFIETWIWKNGFIREYDDFTLIAEAVARDLLGQNILYVEAYFSPRDFARHGLESQGIAGAIRRGLSRVPEVEVMLIPDLIRDFGPENAARTLAELAEVRDEAGIIGIGIGGSEQSFPPEPFAPVYEEARRLGLRTTAHAGEVAGAESIWGALRTLGVDRIGHGTRAYEDPALLDYLAKRRVPVEMCPISNVKTRVVPSIEQHPIRRYFDHGILVTVNTDDPKMFGNSLAEEYAALVDHLGFTHDDIRTLILNGIESSWMDETRKGAMRERFAGIFAEQ
jgi:adenosine deaminase